MGKSSQKPKTTAVVSTTSVEKRKEVKKTSLKSRANSLGKDLRSRFDNIAKRLGFKSKKGKKATKTQKQLERQQKIRGIIGIGLLFVVVSIAYSTYMTALFVDGTAMVLALTPQVAFATIILLIAFYKIYK